MNDPVPPSVRTILELFTGELSDIRFPDVDGELLREAAAQLTRRAQELSQAEAALDRARQDMNEALDLLSNKSSRALAYLRVYAEDKPELLQQLEAVSLPRREKRNGKVETPPKPREVAEPASSEDPVTPRRRGRPPRGSVEAVEARETAS